MPRLTDADLVLESSLAVSHRFLKGSGGVLWDPFHLLGSCSVDQAVCRYPSDTWRLISCFSDNAPDVGGGNPIWWRTPGRIIGGGCWSILGSNGGIWLGFARGCSSMPYLALSNLLSLNLTNMRRCLPCCVFLYKIPAPLSQAVMQKPCPSWTASYPAASAGWTLHIPSTLPPGTSVVLEPVLH